MIVRILVSAVLYFLIDLPWLYLTSKTWSSMILDIQNADVNIKMLPALVVYIALGILQQFPSSIAEAFLLGLTVYAVYDFTNLATFNNYYYSFALLDTLWGGVLFTLVYGLMTIYDSRR